MQAHFHQEKKPLENHNCDIESHYYNTKNLNYKIVSHNYDTKSKLWQTFMTVYEIEIKFYSWYEMLKLWDTES